MVHGINVYSTHSATYNSANDLAEALIQCLDASIKQSKAETLLEVHLIYPSQPSEAFQSTQQRIYEYLQERFGSSSPLCLFIPTTSSVVTTRLTGVKR